MCRSRFRVLPERLHCAATRLAAVLACCAAYACCAAVRSAAAQTAVPATAAWGDFLPAEAMRARSYVRAHPQHDGRGLAVAVLDTGVDPLAAGLQRTSDGQRKVIEARDFSGQGDVALEPVSLHGQVLQLADGHTATVAGLPPSIDGHWWGGQLRESQIGPGELQDLNFDGRRDSVLALVVWRTGHGPDDIRAVIDWDGDGDLADSASVRPFHVAGDLLFAPPRHPRSDAVQLSLAFEADWSRQRAQLHFTDGSHGTHVAGIIAGHQMFGQPGWDGVAPGAQVLSLKIGHNGRSGGATPTGAFAQALKFAGEWTRRTGRPLVVNASYGVPAATEGRADLDREVDRLVQQYPLLTIAFSAGNAGPGLSSLGSPAAADLALAVGAVLPRDAAPALYGGKLTQDELFAFSSRGGELAKPEIVAPGAASASVPVWDGGEIKQGTSMAAPHAAGAMLLVWAALLERAGNRAPESLGWHGGLVRQALVMSAKPLTGYSAVEQGRGMVDVVAAAALAQRLAERPQGRAVLGFHFASQAPRGDGETMPATFLRAGWAGEAPALVGVEVHAWLPAAWTADRKLQWSAAYDLQASADWLEVTRPRVVLRSDRAAAFEVRLRPERLPTAGVYVGHVYGREPGARDDEVAFSHQVTVVVPHQFTAAAQYRRSWPDVQLAAGKVWRQFIAIPAGTQQVRVALRRRDGQFAKVALALFDTDGHRVRPTKRWVSSGDGSDAEWIASGKELTPGVWEVTAAAAVAPGDLSRFDAEVDCTMVQASGPLELSAESGGRASGTVTLTQLGPQPLVAALSGRIDALERSKSLASAEGDRVTHSIVLGPHLQGAVLRLSVDRATYDACTDIAVAVRDSQGNIVTETAFNSPTAEVQWSRKGSGEQRYTLEVTAGFAQPRKTPWSLNVHERLLLERPVALQPKSKDAKTTRLYPFTPTTVGVQAAEPLPQAPHGWRLTGEVHWHSEDGRIRRLTLPARGVE